MEATGVLLGNCSNIHCLSKIRIPDFLPLLSAWRWPRGHSRRLQGAVRYWRRAPNRFRGTLGYWRRVSSFWRRYLWERTLNKTVSRQLENVYLKPAHLSVDVYIGRRGHEYGVEIEVD